MSDSLQLHALLHTRHLYHQLPEFAQTHVHRVGDAIQPSHPLSSPSLPGSKSGDFEAARILIEHVLCSRHLGDTREDTVLVRRRLRALVKWLVTWKECSRVRMEWSAGGAALNRAMKEASL